MKGWKGVVSFFYIDPPPNDGARHCWICLTWSASTLLSFLDHFSKLSRTKGPVDPSSMAGNESSETSSPSPPQQPYYASTPTPSSVAVVQQHDDPQSPPPMSQPGQAMPSIVVVNAEDGSDVSVSSCVCVNMEWALTDIYYPSNNSNNVEPTFHLHTTIILNLVSVMFQRRVHWVGWRMLPRIKSLSAKLLVDRNHLGFMSRKRCNLKRRLLFMVRMDVYYAWWYHVLTCFYCRGATPLTSRSLYPEDPTMHSGFRFQWCIIWTSRKGNQAANFTRDPWVRQYESGRLDRSCLSWNCQHGMCTCMLLLFSLSRGISNSSSL